MLTQPIETISHLSASQPGPLRVIERQELKRQILAALRTLPESQRTATLLFYIDGYSQKEVAGFLEISVDAVKKRLQRARETLRERMLDMVRDELQGQRPSNDDQFVWAVHQSTVLEQAAQEGQLATLELLLVDGFDVNTKGKNGQTLLHWAARTGHLDAIETLVRGGADVNMPDRFGKTPLHRAVEEGRQEAADLIRRHGG